MMTEATLCCLLLALPIVSLAASKEASPALNGDCKVEKENYLGWDALRVSNGIITLHIVPAIGGRVIQFELGGHPYFNIHPKLKGKVVPPSESQFGMSWKNYGGDKIWTAPQGWQNDNEWPGPPDPVLDAGPYTAEVMISTPNEVAVQITSAPDERSGVQIGRTLHIYRGSSEVFSELFMKNISKRTVRWALWEVTQQDTASPENPREYDKDFWAYCPLNSKSAFPKGFNWMFGLVNNPAFSVDETGRFLQIHYRDQVGKIGLDSNAGWLAVVNKRTRYGFFETFEFVPGAAYPDNASVEFWLQGPGEFIMNKEIDRMAPDPEEFPYLFESEILSPLVKLRPGEEYRFRVSWFAGKTGGPITDVNDVGAVHEPLRLSGAGPERTMTGSFAIFYQGRVIATFYSQAGEILSTVSLSDVTPSDEFVLNTKIKVPEKTYRLSLQVHNDKNENLGTLANKVFFD
jgi:hypothetical protein